MMREYRDKNAVDDAKGFLHDNRYAVVATVGRDNKPEAATVYYAMNGRDFYFITETSTRKFENLLNNPYVAITVGFGPTLIGVQMEGEAQMIYTGSDDIRRIATIRR